jgi:BirA family biotin operon repressor/biotin-[acetyl-CoA-carboxylase] ligase
MKEPSGEWFMLEETGSTQDVAATLLEKPDCPGVLFAHHQLDGRGRFRRSWTSVRGDSLTYSLVFHAYAGHPRPWLIGMAVAVAVAQSLDARVQWPNDVVVDGKKVAGVLVEMLPIDSPVRTPVVGVGVNLNQTAFPPELDHRATSVFLQTERRSDPIGVGRAIIARLGALPEPESWSCLEPVWTPLDDTPGKRFLLHSGEEATALHIDPDGALVCQVGDTQRIVLAADAMFG